MVEVREKQNEREIVIRISPRRIAKGVLMLLILFSTFYLGRFSVQPPEFGDLFSGATSAEEKAAPAEKEEVAPAPVVEETPTAAATAEAETAPATTETTTTETAPAADTASDETFVTSYSKVALAIEQVITTWKDTYGKITEIEYTLKNGEAGAIKAAYFKLSVKGYDDFEKKIPIPLSQQKVSAGETVKKKIKVPQGFAYNKVTLGDMNNVQVTLVLYDDLDKKIAETTKSVALEWRGE